MAANSGREYVLYRTLTAEKHFAAWVHKYGAEKATKLYNQIRLIVQNECQGAYDENLSEEKSFGTQMLIQVRRRLKERLEKDRSGFSDCKPEHLLGMCGILTEECKVWWSKQFDLTT